MRLAVFSFIPAASYFIYLVNFYMKTSREVKVRYPHCDAFLVSKACGSPVSYTSRVSRLHSMGATHR